MSTNLQFFNKIMRQQGLDPSNKTDFGYFSQMLIQVMAGKEAATERDVAIAAQITKRAKDDFLGKTENDILPAELLSDAYQMSMATDEPIKFSDVSEKPIEELTPAELISLAYQTE